jgi:hypothetical protein
MLLSILAQTTYESDAAGLWVFLIIVAAIFAAIGAAMARKRFRPPWVGALLGFLLGWIGLIVIAVMGAKAGPPCVSCGMPLQQSWVGGQVMPARVCMMCGADQRQPWGQQPQPQPVYPPAQAPQGPPPQAPAPPPMPPAPVG